MSRICLIFWALWLSFPGRTSAADGVSKFNYDENKVPAYELPDVLTTNAGDAVTSVSEWTARRKEILQLFEQHVYGRRPDASLAKRIRLTHRSQRTDAVNGKALRREMTLTLGSDTGEVALELLIYTPRNLPGPVPCFLAYNFGGNHTVTTDPSIHLSTSWVRQSRPNTNPSNTAQEASRGRSRNRWPVEKIIDAGLGLITLYYGDVDPDFDDGFRNGIHALEREEERTGDAGGSISAWAWGLSRVMDVLALDPSIDARRIALMGHSRLGKTALWAGATEPRFALVISNNSGCGGAALSRRQFGETVARINTSFPHWFCRNFRTYNDNEAALPVDQHMLVALIAPRPVYIASAEEDRWADPRGEMLSLYHATPVFELFGKAGLSTDRMPALNDPVHTDVGYHIRSGKHNVTEYDWQQYIKFAKHHLGR